MTKSKVYWFGPRSPPSNVVKGQRLFELAGFGNCFDKGDSVAIKIHCGEWNNTGYLRPSFVASIVETVREYGGDPFVCDTTTLYMTGRTTGQDLLKTAARNGFTEATLGCPFIVADGINGLNDVKVEVDGNLLRYTYVARSIADADALIALSHFKGHPSGVFGGAIKNLGIGCLSRRGKVATHLGTHPIYGKDGREFNPDKCEGKDCPIYDTCRENCPMEAFQLKNEPPYVSWDSDLCIGCLNCFIRTRCGVFVMPNRTFVVPVPFADSAKAVIETVGEDHVGFINYAIDISPACDCVSYSDSWILPNLGVFASKDIIAVDMACLDASDKAEGVSSSKLFDEGIIDEPWKAGHEKFTYVALAPRNPEVSQWIQINAALNIGLGSVDYELIEATPGPSNLYVMPKFRDHPPGFWVRKAFKAEPPRPDPASYRERPRISIEELIKKPK